MARKTGDTVPAGMRSVLHPCPREGEALSVLLPKNNAVPASLQGGNRNAKSPASEEAGRTIRMDQSPLRRDQIRVKPSSPSTFTSEA
jgi:hypothetical protein